MPAITDPGGGRGPADRRPVAGDHGQRCPGLAGAEGRRGPTGRLVDRGRALSLSVEARHVDDGWTVVQDVARSVEPDGTAGLDIRVHLRLPADFSGGRRVTVEPDGDQWVRHPLGDPRPGRGAGGPPGPHTRGGPGFFTTWFRWSCAVDPDRSASPGRAGRRRLHRPRVGVEAVGHRSWWLGPGDRRRRPGKGDQRDDDRVCPYVGWIWHC